MRWSSPSPSRAPRTAARERRYGVGGRVVLPVLAFARIDKKVDPFNPFKDCPCFIKSESNQSGGGVLFVPHVPAFATNGTGTGTATGTGTGEVVEVFRIKEAEDEKRKERIKPTTMPRSPFFSRQKSQFVF